MWPRRQGFLLKLVIKAMSLAMTDRIYVELMARLLEKARPSSGGGSTVLT